MTTRQVLEERIFWDCQISEDEARKLKRRKIKTENAVITNAYFGRWPNPGLRPESPLGLNVTVSFESVGQATATYVGLETIGTFMHAFETESVKWLEGRSVTAYLYGPRLVGIAVRR